MFGSWWWWWGGASGGEPAQATPIATIALPARYEPTLRLTAAYSPAIDMPARV